MWTEVLHKNTLKCRKYTLKAKTTNFSEWTAETCTKIFFIRLLFMQQTVMISHMNVGVEDAVALLLSTVILMVSRTLLFIEFSSAFNYIQPHILADRLTNMFDCFNWPRKIPESECQWCFIRRPFIFHSLTTRMSPFITYIFLSLSLFLVIRTVSKAPYWTILVLGVNVPPLT